uniref:Uncharacterized protein n=1 Tax=Rhizophora mucronata TaxID=61149 RepID=A0A2P2PBZ4_RHIMU
MVQSFHCDIKVTDLSHINNLSVKTRVRLCVSGHPQCGGLMH